MIETLGTQAVIAGLLLASHCRKGVPMYSRLIGSTLVVASLLVAPVIAFAQTEPAAKPRVTHHTMKSGHVRTGTTTGMSPTGSSPGQGKARPGGQSVSGKPAGS